jgi:hypothetical protein
VTAAELFADLARQGFTLAGEGDGIRVTPASRLTEELRQAIRVHKAALLTLLAGPEGPPPAFAWDQAEAERLLAELRDEVKRAEALDFGGQPPPLFKTLAADLLAQAEGYIRDHDKEAARGWDALELLRGVEPVLRGVVSRLRAVPPAG